MKKLLLLLLLSTAHCSLSTARAAGSRPLMGWSSWNTFGVEISEDLILETARAMATNGLQAAGYTFVNIDDGFFWGHGEDGKLRIHPTRFPNGLKPVVDGIHALGLKAGIYSDAGQNTCGNIWGGDKGGRGGGLFGHDESDCALFFIDLGFDFIKVDYCGGEEQKLDEQKRYTEIAKAIKATGRTDVRLNVCRWAYPGAWVKDIAESWRTTYDIRANWKSIKSIILENLYLSAYASFGHYNDLDMLEVGHHVGKLKTAFGENGDVGLTLDEEHTHFGLWCILSSPLLIGCDARNVPEETFALITNPYLLAMNQNDLGLQAYVAARDGEAYTLVKDALQVFGRSRYVAVCNLGDTAKDVTVRAADLDLAGKVDVFDLTKKAAAGSFTDALTVSLAPHASRFYRFDAERRVPRAVYEAETAFLPAYQELRDPEKAGTAHPAETPGASGGVAVRNLGGSAANGLVWRVRVEGKGEAVLRCRTPEPRALTVSVDGRPILTVTVPAAEGWQDVPLTLPPGDHTVRLDNAFGPMPDIDKLTLHTAHCL